jgi:hypothetical protein
LPWTTSISINFFQLLRDALRQHGVDSWLEDGSRISFKAKPNTRKLSFREKMRIIMGMQESTILLNPNVNGINGFNVKRFLPQQIFFTTDIIHHQMIGGGYDQVLRCVSVDFDKYSYGCSAHERFETIHYYPVNHEKIDDVQIYI